MLIPPPTRSPGSAPVNKKASSKLVQSLSHHTSKAAYEETYWKPNCVNLNLDLIYLGSIDPDP